MRKTIDILQATSYTGWAQVTLRLRLAPVLGVVSLFMVMISKQAIHETELTSASSVGALC